jgi:signal transduction histidine kinase
VIAMRRFLPWALCALALAIGVVTTSVVVLVPAGVPAGGRLPLAFWLSFLLAQAASAVVGAVVATRQPRNPIGWMLIGIGICLGLDGGGQYITNAAFAPPGTYPIPALVGLLSLPAWTLGLGLFLLMLSVFPDGRALSTRWRWLLRLSILGLLVTAFSQWFDPEALYNAGTGYQLKLANPIGIPAATKVILGIQHAAGIITLLIALISGLASSVIRYRRGSSELRHQVKWVLVAVTFVGLTSAVSIWLGNALPDWTGVILGIAYLAVPVSIAAAVLKYRLYDIDVVISRTLVYGALAAFITSVYVAIVVGIGTLVGSGGKPNLALSIVATAIVAVAFQPVRERIQKVANRLVYGKRATPYEVLSQFSERVAESYAADDVLPRMAHVLADGTGADRAQVWLRAGPTLRSAAVWPNANGAAPAESPGSVPLAGDTVPEISDATRVVEVRHQGELLGALTVTKRQGESLTPVEEKLLDDLAGQAGLVLKNVGLTAELLQRLEDLRASRQRLVAAQDEERRRLERNLHDGAQQNLVALKVKLGLAEIFAEKDPARAKATLAELKVDTDEALETLRDLARGIYPPLLADKGLVAAFEAQARKATLPVTVETNSVGRYSQDIEAAVYFCCLEALQNVQKYAGASKATVRLTEEADELRFQVFDDGKGFDPILAKKGSGLTNMEDRFQALGGSIQVTSAVGRGTTVTGAVVVAGVGVS